MDDLKELKLELKNLKARMNKLQRGYDIERQGRIKWELACREAQRRLADLGQ